MAEVQAAAARWRALLRHQWTYGWAAAVRTQLRRLAKQAAVRRRFAPTSYVTLMRSRWQGKAFP